MRKLDALISGAAVLVLVPDPAKAADPAGHDDSPSSGPNFIIIFVDDLGYNDLGFRNPSFYTPNIDALASESVEFVNAYVPSPTSSPSRAALLTGKYPVKYGITRHINNRNPDPFGTGEYEILETDPGHIPNRKFLPKSEVTAAEVLRQQGYRTVAIGKWHLGTRDYYPDKQGFDEMYGESDLGNPVSYFPDYFRRGGTRNDCGEYLTDWLTDFAVNVIKENDYSRSPLFLYLAHYGVHSPHQAPEEMVSKYREKGLDERYAVYHAMVESVDISTGRIMAALEEAGVEDETVLVFVSDQGGFFSNEPLRGGKLTGALYEGGAKVPFFVKTPDTAGHMVMEDRITTMDLFPTFMDYAGVPSGCRPELDGQSLYGLLHGGSYEKRPIFFYRSYEDQPAAVIYGDYKFIWSRCGNYELYNLVSDPYESTDLSGSCSRGDRRAYKQCYKLLRDFLSRYEPAPVY